MDQTSSGRLAKARGRRIALVLASLGVHLALGGGFARAEAPGACAKLSDVEMVQLLNQWRAEITSGSPDRISALYAVDATLIVSKSGKTYQGRDAIRAYYKDFLAKRPALSIKPANLTPGCNTASISGPAIYRISGERKGTRTLLGGGYMIEFALRDGNWLIVRHSLAADPRGIGDAFGGNVRNP
jgi:hypothetical protein